MKQPFSGKRQSPSKKQAQAVNLGTTVVSQVIVLLHFTYRRKKLTSLYIPEAQIAIQPYGLCFISVAEKEKSVTNEYEIITNERTIK